jgi:5-methylcytosine-specific restriction endonuclease McrA
MLARYKEYEDIVKHKRKLFTEVQKRKIACRQKYRCMGELCLKTNKKRKKLPEVWELDHIIPLFMGGTNYYNFDTKNDILNNLQIICSSCHAIKTQQEKIKFYSNERDNKYPQKDFVLAKDFYKSDEESIDTIPEKSILEKRKFCFDDYKYRAKKKEKRK